MPLPAAYERSLPKARRYFDVLSAERGELVRPKLPRGLLFFRATRAPFLSATFAPVLLGLAVAARVGMFDVLTAVITLVAASFVHLGLNVANDVFDRLQGADDANPTPPSSAVARAFCRTPWFRSAKCPRWPSAATAWPPSSASSS